MSRAWWRAPQRALRLTKTCILSLRAARSPRPARLHLRQQNNRSLVTTRSHATLSVCGRVVGSSWRRSWALGEVRLALVFRVFCVVSVCHYNTALVFKFEKKPQHNTA